MLPSWKMEGVRVYRSDDCSPAGHIRRGLIDGEHWWAAIKSVHPVSLQLRRRQRHQDVCRLHSVKTNESLDLLGVEEAAEEMRTASCEQYHPIAPWKVAESAASGSDILDVAHLEKI
jgi:hypothetical protein